MSDNLHLYYVVTTVRSAIVSDSSEHAVAASTGYVSELALAGVERCDAATLAVEPPTDPDDAAVLPAWEILPERDDPRLRWTIRRWVAEQAPKEPPVALVNPADDWRGPPSRAEVRAHHATHKDAWGGSHWCVDVGNDNVYACRVYDSEEDQEIGIGECYPTARYRPADARWTPVAWPVLKAVEPPPVEAT